MTQATTAATTLTLSGPTNAEAYWTCERVYLDPQPGSKYQAWPPCPNFTHPAYEIPGDWFTPEFRAELMRETDWESLDEYTWLSDEEFRVVRYGGACPRCSRGGYLLRFRGSVTGIVIQQRREKCPCKYTKLLMGIWLDVKLVPERFRDVFLHTLQPVGAPTSKLPVSMQEKVIATLQNNPDRSYLLIGDAGTGKTHFSFGLFQHAVTRWAQRAFEEASMWERSVFRFNVKSLLDQHVAWATKADDNTKEPDLTVKKITALVNKGHKVSLFLDEIDKFNPTKYKMDCLLELVDAVYVGKGQVVAVSNAPVSKLEKIWGEFTDPDAIIRRIRGEEANGTQITFRAG